MMARDSDEVLSFGTFTTAAGPFEPHASLNAQSNGTLAVKAAGLDLLPGGGEASLGSGERDVADTSCSFLNELPGAAAILASKLKELG